MRQTCGYVLQSSLENGAAPSGRFVMRRIATKAELVVTGFVAVLSVAGCGTNTIIETVTKDSNVATTQSSTSVSAATANQRQPAPTTSASRPGPRWANTGSTLILHGQSGEVMAVTVDAVMDPLPVGSFDQADAGQRFVGVQITLHNVGSISYSDSPANGATLLSNVNEQATSEIVSGGPCGNNFSASANIAPGGTQQGCLPFEMPDGQTPGMFQFTLNSGFANQTGQWSLTTAAQSTGTTPSAVNSATNPSSTSSASPPEDPLAAVRSYWDAIDAHDFAAAYRELAPGALSLSEAQFVGQENRAAISSASFSGTVFSNNGGSAAVDVTSLITKDAQFGCRSWSGSYQLVNQSGQWFIQRASISPRACS